MALQCCRLLRLLRVEHKSNVKRNITLEVKWGKCIRIWKQNKVCFYDFFWKKNSYSNLKNFEADGIKYEGIQLWKNSILKDSCLYGIVSDGIHIWRDSYTYLWKDTYLMGFEYEEKTILKGFMSKGVQIWRGSNLEGFKSEGSQIWRNSNLKKVQNWRDSNLMGFWLCGH